MNDSKYMAKYDAWRHTWSIYHLGGPEQMEKVGWVEGSISAVEGEIEKLLGRVPRLVNMTETGARFYV